MNSIEKSILNQLWIYTKALQTLIVFKLTDKYPAQVDITIDNMLAASQMLVLESKRQLNEVKNVSKC